MASLINSDTHGWVEEVVNTLFWEEDAELILCIPVPRIDTAAVRVLHYTKSGILLG